MSKPQIHRVRIVNPRLKPEAMPQLTGHAIIRYAERMLGLDLVKARLVLTGPEVQRAILHGADAVVVGDMKVCLDGKKVVTVLGKQQRPKKTNRVLKSFAELEAL